MKLNNVIKIFIKSILPNKLRVNLKYFYNTYIQNIGLSDKDVFKKIYLEKLWGGNEIDKFYSGSGSREKKLTDLYIKIIKKFLYELKNPIVVDCGCGDFNVGKNFVKHTKHYYAFDIVDELIDYNKKKFLFPNLSFKIKDITKDPIPKTNVLLVRQVLQHLNNGNIKKFIHNFSKKTDYLIVTEDLPNNNFVPNKDKKTNALIRFSSGVVLHKYPFFLKYKEKKVLSEIKINDSRIMKTYLYKL